MKEKIVKENLKRENKGITLIALIITIVVLIILAGVAINLTIGNNGIFTKAKQAREDYKMAANEEQTMLDSTNLDAILAGAPNGLTIGTEVTYIPSGTYTWLAKYASSDLEDKDENNTLLSSEEGKDFQITKWKVFDINSNTNKIELVATSPTIGKVSLEGAQGYNNGVKLLNDACNSLYGDSSKYIVGRSINIKDIEEKMSYNPNTYINLNVNVKYGESYEKEYKKPCKEYPMIYSKESNRKINGEDANVGLKLSEQIEFIENIQDEFNRKGYTISAYSIQPMQTWYHLDYENFNLKLGKNKTLILPAEQNTEYWIASRSILLDKDKCYFFINRVNKSLAGDRMFSSDTTSGNGSRSLFPIVTVNANQIKGTQANGYKVE